MNKQELILIEGISPYTINKDNTRIDEELIKKSIISITNNDNILFNKFEKNCIEKALDKIEERMYF